MPAAADLVTAARRLAVPPGDGPGDPDLLARYARDRDQEAFAALVRRYGPLVLGVARRQLADRHRAEDVFQATFLALARAAGRLGRRPVLANWLYTVALRQARKARGRDARRAAVEQAAHPPAKEADPLAAVTARELLRALDDEIARLPDRLRLPVLLCGVQGLARDDAARRLGWTDGMVKGRLERGRRLLAARLAARGLAPSAVLLALPATVAVPADLLARAADHAAAPWAGTVPPAVAALAAAAAPRSSVPALAVAGTVLAAALAGWAAASGGANPVQPTPAPAAAAAAQPPAAAPVPDDPLPAGAAVRFGTSRYRHPSEIEDLAVSPDGAVAVACGGTRLDGAVRAYDLATGRVLYTLDAEDVESVAFSPDGKTLARRSFKSGPATTVHLHDAATGAAAGRFDSPRMAAGLAFSPDGRRLAAVAAGHQAVHLLDVPPGREARTLPHAGTIFAIAFSPDGRYLAAGGYEKGDDGVYFVRLWDVATGTEARRVGFGRWGIRSVAFSADGATLAVGGDHGLPPVVKLFDTATWKERLAVPVPAASAVRSLAFSPDGKTVAAAGESAVRLFDAATGAERVRVDRRASGLRFSPDGATLVGAVAGAVYRWDAATGRSLIPEGGDSWVARIAATADGARVVTVGYEGDGHVWDARTGRHLRRVDMTRSCGFALSPDGRFLVWPEVDETIRYTLDGRTDTVYFGSRLRMAAVADGAPVDRFGGFEGDAQDLYFTPDGKSLVTMDGASGRVRVWDAATGKVVRSFRGAEPGAFLCRSRLSPDGAVLGVSYQRPRETSLNTDSVRKLWDLATGTEVAGPVPPWFDPEVAAFGPDRATMAVARPQGVVEFRDAATGRGRGEHRGPRGRVTALAFGPDGRLFTGAPDGTVLGWDVRPAGRE